MGDFVYEGLRQGRKIKGRISAEGRKEAIARLKSEGIIPLEIREESGRGSFLKREFHLRKPSDEDLSFVLLQISVLLESGLTLARSLELVAGQIEDQRISGALLSVKADLERGESLSRAFRTAGIFPGFLPEMLTAAETGENLEKIFKIAGEHLETVADMKVRIVNAVVYPAVVISFSLIALFVAIKFVVPKIAGVLEGLGRELPLITKAVIVLSDVISIFFWILPLITVLLIFRERSYRLIK
jgi:type IV pilus assembly protein PilC